MRSIVTGLLFPYFLPLVAISVTAFAWMLVTPDPPNVLGPTGSDVLGLYFIMLCVLVGGVAQVVIGVPFCLLLKWIGSPVWRLILASLAAALVLVPFASSLLETQSQPTFLEHVATLAVVGGCVFVGVWIPLRTFRPEVKREAESDPGVGFVGSVSSRRDGSD